MVQPFSVGTVFVILCNGKEKSTNFILNLGKRLEETGNIFYDFKLYETQILSEKNKIFFQTDDCVTPRYLHG